MNGVLVVDKPADYTSFDVVAVVRRLAGREKTGHTGTLDPMATGVLPILLGKATRAASLLEDTSKEYRAEFAFGYATDTQDSTGEVLARSDVRVTKDALLAALPHFRGNILQEPPMYSAVRKDGKRLYELARQGITVEREKRPVTIETLECIRFDEASQTGALEVRCSKGTYIRTLCADIAAALGTYGVMTALRRTSACGFSLEDAVPLDLPAFRWRPRQARPPSLRYPTPSRARTRVPDRGPSACTASGWIGRWTRARAPARRARPRRRSLGADCLFRARASTRRCPYPL